MHHLLVVMRGNVFREHSRSALVPSAMAPPMLCAQQHQRRKSQQTEGREGLTPRPRTDPGERC
jgi:hypothetical protein